MSDARKVIIDPLIDNNPVTLQMLGICSALAVTTALLPALLMCAALTSVTALSAAAMPAWKLSKMMVSVNTPFAVCRFMPAPFLVIVARRRFRRAEKIRSSPLTLGGMRGISTRFSGK